MRLFQISVLFLFFFLCLNSCKENLDQRPNSNSKENKAPYIKQKSSERSIPNKEFSKPKETLEEKELQKKATKTIDTLKPIAAIP